MLASEPREFDTWRWILGGRGDCANNGKSEVFRRTYVWSDIGVRDCDLDDNERRVLFRKTKAYSWI